MQSMAASKMESTTLPVCNSSKTIVAYAKVSSADSDLASKYKWRLLNGYAYANVDGITTTLHHLVMGKPSLGMVIDHRNRDRLDNTRENLRIVSFSQNNQNKTLRQGTSSAFRGVTWRKDCNRWGVSCGHRYVGIFENEQEAARAYDLTALKLFGKNATLNFPLSAEAIDACIEEALIPTGIKIVGPSFFASLYWKKRRLEIGTFASLQEAEEAILSTKLELILDDVLVARKKTIIRNADGIACIPIRDQNGQISRNALVSDEDWHQLSRHKWCNSNGYAHGHVDGQFMSMHRLILIKDLHQGKIVDHVNRDRSDNRRQNLRVTDASTNNQNRKKKDQCSSQYVGVTKKRNSWSTVIHKNNVTYNLGCFPSEIEAATRYNIEALRLYDNPMLNEVDGKTLISMEDAFRIVHGDLEAYVERIEKPKKPKQVKKPEEELPRPARETSSKYRGISWSKHYKKWIVSIQCEKKHHYIGSFEDEVTAAQAYNQKARELFGSAANLNDIVESETPITHFIDSVTDGSGCRKQNNRSSIYKGVSKTANGTFNVELKWKKKRYRGQTHKSEVEAAKRFNELVLQVCGDAEDRPRLNIIPEE